MNKALDIGFRLKKINDALTKNADRMMKEMDVTFSQHHVLVYLDHQEDKKSTLKNIEHTFHVSQATVAGIAKRMEEKKLIAYFSDPNDKRIKWVKLTDEGLKICEKSKVMMKETEKKMKSLFSEEEMKDFEEYLDRIFEALDKEEFVHVQNIK